MKVFFVVELVIFFTADEESATHINYDNVADAFGSERRIDRGVVIGPAVLKGKQAAVSLLKNARPVPSGRLFSRQFEKSGSYQQALRDFESVRPSNVEEYTLPGSIKGMRGEAGDLTILLENTGENGNAMMKLFHKLQDPYRSTIDKIYYKRDH